MMTSNEVAQMMAAQNQMFMGQNTWANQIGMGRAGVAPSPMGGHGTPFSYAPGGMLGPGMGGGNRFAGGVMSGMGAGAGLAGMGLGVAGMFGALGKVGGAMVDPFSMFGAMRGMGMGMAGSLGMAALPIAGAMAAGQVVSSFVQGGQQQSAINNTLSNNFQFFNPSSRSGQGFSRQDSQAIGDSIRQLSHIPELMTSVEELTKMLPKLKSSGVMQGVREVGEFNKRFKESIATIRDMSKILGTTMEEASEFFAQSRGAGFTGRNAQLRNVLNAQFTSGVTGMTMGQTMQLQQSGANMATAMGTKRSIGSTAVMNMAQTLGVAQREGRIAEGALEDMTGLQGAEAVQAAAGRMTEAMANFSSRSPVGRLLMAGLAKFDENGRATGFDEKLVEQLRSGALSVDDLKKRAGRLTNDQKISFTHRSATLGMSLASQVGAGGVADIFQSLLGGKGTDADRLMMSRHTGLNENEVDVAMGMAGMEGLGQAESAQHARFSGREAAIRERTDPSAIMRRIKTRLHSSTLGGIEAGGAKVFNAIGKAYDEFVDDLVGRHVMTLTKEGASKLEAALSGGSKDELKAMFAAANGITGGQARGFSAMDALTLHSPLLGMAMGGSPMESSKRLAKAARGTDAMAFLMRGEFDTGRTDEAQFERAQDLLGMRGQTGVDLVGKALNNGLVGEASSDVQRLVRQAAYGVDNFRDMSSERKMDELHSALTDQMDRALTGAGGLGINLASFQSLSPDRQEAMLARMEESGGKGAETAKLIRAGRDAQKNFKGDFVTGLIAAGQGKFEGGGSQIDFTKLGKDNVDFRNAEAVSKYIKDAESELQDKEWSPSNRFSDESMAAIKGSSGARKILQSVGGKDEDAIRKALDQSDDEIAVRQLKRLGIDVKPGELKGIRDAYKVVDTDKETRAKIQSGISKLEKGLDAGNTGVIMKSFARAAEDLRDTAKATGGAGGKAAEELAAAFEEFSKTKDVDKLFTARDTYLDSLRKDAGGAAAGGVLGQQGGRVLKELGGVKTEKELRAKLKRLGMDDEAMKNIIGSENVADGISAEELKGIQNRAFGMKMSGVVAGKGGKSEVASVEDRMLDTLMKLDKTMALSTTIMATMSKDPKHIAAAAANASREDQSPPKT